MIFVLLIAYQLKHFICDYPLKGKFMLGKFKPGWDFLGPLTAHCAVHMLFTILITLAVTEEFLFALGLGLIDFVLHYG